MARFLRRMQAPINSNKHFVSQTLSTVLSGTISTRIVSDAVAAPATANAFDVRQGAVIKAVYIELWINGDSAATVSTSFNVTLEKLPSNLASMTFANSQNLGTYTNKKNILYTTQGLVGSADIGQSSVPVLRTWFKIPKGKQRQGLGDRIVLNLSSLVSDLAICGIFIYKEYT